MNKHPTPKPEIEVAKLYKELGMDSIAFSRNNQGDNNVWARIAKAVDAAHRQLVRVMTGES
jgi:hypothetical protein